MDSIYSIIITFITVLGSTSAFRYYERRTYMKKQQSNQERDECRVRIEKLEILLDKSSEEKDIMREQILKLTEQVSALKVKVEFLEKENKELSEKKNRS